MQNDKASFLMSDLANIHNQGIEFRGMQTSEILDNTMTFEFSDSDTGLTPTE